MLTQLGAIPNMMFQQRPVVNTPQSNVESSSSPTETTNNSLNTFRTIEKGKANDSDRQISKLGEAIANASKTTSSSAESNDDKTATSDARCKKIFGNDSLSDDRCKELFGNTDLLSSISDLNEYVYKYKKSAQENPALKDKHVDDEIHVGPVAQELKENPITEGTVKEDPLSGFLTVDTAQLSLVEMSILSAMAKRILRLEEIIKEEK